VPGDARRLAEITVAGWRTAYVGIVPDNVLVRQSVDHHAEYFATEEALAPPMRTWVVEDDGYVVAYAHAGPFRPEPGEHIEAGELWGMYVDPQHQSRGHGQALMAAVLDHFRDACHRTAYLWVMRDNTAARRFYEVAGWHLDESAARSKPVPQVRYRVAM
jgi:GNAT superfamily N-acetyltransferase